MTQSPPQHVRDLFLSDVTRDIPPVVYFHEHAPDKLATEVSEYIITGGWPENHPHHRRVPNGIHEQYVSLLGQLTTELERPDGPDLPTVWISGFYGSGKSSFAKLLGYALDGVALPDGTSLSEAWLRRDTSPRAPELRSAWARLRQKIDPIAVVFDVGSAARDNEHIHAAAIRQVQHRLGYCRTEPLVADFELRLEIDGKWSEFERTALETLGRPWAEVKDKALAEEDFSLVMSVMFPDRYTDPMSWYISRGGTHARSESPEEAVEAISAMLNYRARNKTLFIVIDEVSQYVLSHKDRVDRLRAFATALGARLRGKAWLFALGQQKLDEEADSTFLVWARDRFPPKLRVHLAATNIRDVVHKRLLQKTPAAETHLRTLFERHRTELKLYAYGCENVTADEFVEVYPLLPGQIDLILRITSALRTRSSRAQGDDQAIRGLLQLLGELFRQRKLADRPVGSLVTFDEIYEVQHTALDSDVQDSMARILAACSTSDDALLVRAAKAVALLELIQDDGATPTSARFVAQCLFDTVTAGNLLPAVTTALENLKDRNLLGYSEKLGYRIQSSAGEEWERERRDIGVNREAIIDIVHKALAELIATPDRPRLHGRPFPFGALFSDGRRTDDLLIVDARDSAAVRVDFRLLSRDERTESTWVRKTADAPLSDRLVWVAADADNLEQLARELHRSRGMVRKYAPRRLDALNPARRMLLQQEENRSEDLERLTRQAVADTWFAGRIYFRGRVVDPRDHGAAFATALHAAATRILPDLFPHFVNTQVTPGELAQLLVTELSGPSAKFLDGDLGILELDAGRYVPTCNGVVPKRIHDFITAEGGTSGTAILAHFGAPPWGYTAEVVKACIAGLVRAGKIRIQPDGGTEITAIRDVGVSDLFTHDRIFRRATISPAGDDDIGVQGRARICRFFSERLSVELDREDHLIADAVALHFPPLAQRLRHVQSRLNQLATKRPTPPALEHLYDALEKSVASCRQTRAVVRLVMRRLDVLRDGVTQLQMIDAELTDAAVQAVRKAQDVTRHEAAQLEILGDMPTNVARARDQLVAQLESERPWRDIIALQPAIDEVRACYRHERTRLLERQESLAEAARARIKARDGFATLTADQSHHVLRPIAQASTDTTPDAVAPVLGDLRDVFDTKLARAEDTANELLDELLSQGNRPIITTCDLQLRNREITSEADITRLVEDIRTRLLAQLKDGVRIRLV